LNIKIDYYVIIIIIIIIVIINAWFLQLSLLFYVDLVVDFFIVMVFIDSRLNVWQVCILFIDKHLKVANRHVKAYGSYFLMWSAVVGSQQIPMSQQQTNIGCVVIDRHRAAINPSVDRHG
jgi:hypothetical protein